MQVLGPRAASAVVPREATQYASMVPRSGSATLVAAHVASCSTVTRLIAMSHPSRRAARSSSSSTTASPSTTTISRSPVSDSSPTYAPRFSSRRPPRPSPRRRRAIEGAAGATRHRIAPDDRDGRSRVVPRADAIAAVGDRRLSRAAANRLVHRFEKARARKRAASDAEFDDDAHSIIIAPPRCTPVCSFPAASGRPRTERTPDGERQMSAAPGSVPGDFSFPRQHRGAWDSAEIRGRCRGSISNPESRV